MESSVQHFLEPDPVIFLETPKRKPCALRAGHRYLFSKKNCFDIIFWRCERYFKEKCKGSMATAGNTIVKAISHTCIPDPSRVDIITALHACRRRVREDIHTPISRIVAEEFTPLRDRGVDNVPSYLSLKSSLHRERQKHLANRLNPGDFLCIEAIPGTSESTNNNFAPTADFSYQGSYDGSHCGNSVLQDSTNNMDASYDNTYDTIYDDSVAPPPIKRKRPTSSSDNLNENYQAFSELVVAKLKSLPANRAALLQLKIQELLSREIVNLEMDEGDNETEEEVCGEQEGEEEEEMSLETGSKPNEIETPPSRSEECPNETTQVEHKTTTTTTSVTTTIAKKRKVAPAQVHDSAENKENAQVFLDDSYRAFSKCIVSQLRYLPTPVAVKTQNKIQRVLSDEISEFYNKTASASQEPEETSPSIRVKEEPLDYNDS